MCVSYHRLNQVTLPFEYPSIPRCDDAINNFGDSNGRLYFISLDNKTGYHQIGVGFADQDKLPFFWPDGKKYTFSVMPFGPRNAPAFYTCMMLFFGVSSVIPSLAVRLYWTILCYNIRY
jgi:hypothetical protein